MNTDSPGSSNEVILFCVFCDRNSQRFTKGLIYLTVLFMAISLWAYGRYVSVVLVVWVITTTKLSGEAKSDLWGRHVTFLSIYIICSHEAFDPTEPQATAADNRRGLLLCRRPTDIQSESRMPFRKNKNRSLKTSLPENS